VSSMGETLQVLCRLIPILAFIALGCVFRHTGFVSSQVMEGMKKLAVNLALPVVIFLSLLRLEIKASYLVLALFVFLISMGLLCVGRGIGRLLRWENPYASALFTGYENGMLGYGVLAAALGQTNIYPIVIMDLGQTLFFSLVFVTYMRVLNREIVAVSSKSIGRAFLTNPYVWASALAILLNCAGCVPLLETSLLTQGLFEGLEQLSALTTPIMGLAIGYGLRIKRDYLRRSFLIIALRLLLLSSIAFLLDTFLIKGILHLGTVFSVSVYTMFLLPPFFVGALLIKEEAVEEREFALSTISFHILIFLVLFCVMLPLFPGS